MFRRLSIALAATLFAASAFAQATRTLYGESGTITAGGTAQSIFASNVPVNGWEVCNPDTLDLWVSDFATAVINGAGSYRVPANGGCYITPRTGQPNVLGPVSLIGASTGQKYTARKW
jgi:hypothetical protein